MFHICHHFCAKQPKSMSWCITQTLFYQPIHCSNIYFLSHKYYFLSLSSTHTHYLIHSDYFLYWKIICIGSLLFSLMKIIYSNLEQKLQQLLVSAPCGMSLVCWTSPKHKHTLRNTDWKPAAATFHVFHPCCTDLTYT